MAVGAKGVRAGRAYVELGVQDKLARGLRRAQARLKAFGAGVTQIGKGMMKLGAVAMAPLLGAAKVFSSMGDRVAKMAKRTGFSVEALSELTYVASQTGTELGDLEKVVRRMQRSIYDAERGLSTAVDGFADLGLSAEDFKGLKPEEQFKLMADRIAGVEDPSRKAAIAMTLLGRSGTALLPMMAGGAAGIDKLMKTARTMGLTMSKEDAVAAELLTDKMDLLWKVVKMGAFNVGAALVPILVSAANTITDVATRISDWIKTNRGLIVSVFKIAGLVIAGGAALAVLGWGISTVAALFGVLATAVSALAAVLAFVLSPLGLVTAAVAGLGAYILFATETGAKWLGWLGDAFGDLKADASKSFEGIKRAMSAGDMGLAAEILWLTLMKWWHKGSGWLLDIWYDMKETMVLGITKGFYAIAKAWVKVVKTLHKYWIGLKTIFEQGKSAVHSYIATTKTKAHFSYLADLERTAAKRGKITKEQLGNRLADLKQQEAYALSLHKKTGDKRLKAIEDEAKAKVKALNAEEKAQIGLLRRGEKRGREFWQKQISEDRAQNAKDLKTAEDKLKAALAKTPEGEGGVGGPPKPGDLDEMAERFRNALGDLPGQLATAAKRGSARGTFSARAIQSLMMGGGNAAERTANAVERIAKYTKVLPRAGKLTFS